MNYARIKNCDVANGPGVRVTLFVSGCRHQCKNCFNKEAWDFEYGEKFTNLTREVILELLKPDYITGLSVLGGEPFEPENIVQVGILVHEVRERYPNKSIWVYTGGLYENINTKTFYKECENAFMAEAGKRIVFENIDVLVDGPFIEEKKDLMLKFRGSSNQRLIDMKKTLECGEVVLLDESTIKSVSRSDM